MDQRTERLTSMDAVLEKYRSVLYSHDETVWEIDADAHTAVVSAVYDQISSDCSWGAVTCSAMADEGSSVYSYRRSYRIHYPKQNWWLVRELARLHSGEYEPLPAHIAMRLSQLGCWRWEHFVHMAMGGDKEVMVAYTPTRDSGVKDVQLRTTFGRYLRGNFSFLPDEVIQDLDAQLRAHLTAELTLVDDQDEMFRIYQLCSPACMSKDPDEYDLDDDVHPLDCYAPQYGWRVATVYDENKRPRARSTVWINPDNADDKRFGRTYGDAAIRTLLMRNGFKDAPFDGAKLAVVLDDDDQIVLPYIDGHENNMKPTNRYFKLVDPIELVSEKEYCQLSDRFRLEWHSADARTGRSLPSSRRWTCGACNQLTDATQRSTRVLRPNDSVANTCPSCMANEKRVVLAHTIYGRGSTALRDDCVQLNGVWVHADRAVLRYHGFDLLSSEVYDDTLQNRVVPLAEVATNRDGYVVRRDHESMREAPFSAAEPLENLENELVVTIDLVSLPSTTVSTAQSLGRIDQRVFDALRVDTN